MYIRLIYDELFIFQLAPKLCLETQIFDKAPALRETEFHCKWVPNLKLGTSSERVARANKLVLA